MSTWILHVQYLLGKSAYMLGLLIILIISKLMAMVGHVNSFAPFLAGNNWMVQKNG